MPSSDGPSSPQTSPLKPLMSLFGFGRGDDARKAETDAHPEEVDLVDQAEAFRTLRVEDVMTPRADVVAVELATPLRELVARFVEAEHSRMPIYQDTLDRPVGLVHIKDLVRLMAPADGSAPDWDALVLPEIKREVLYVPASMKAEDLLHRMRTERLHMALVIDEFGGTDGLVTLEDVVEAVVGDIADEYDEAEASMMIVRPDGDVEMDARAPLDEVESLMGLSLHLAEADEEIDTVGGLVASISGRVPEAGEVVEHPAGVLFEVLEADPRRILRLRAKRTEQPERLEAEAS